MRALLVMGPSLGCARVHKFHDAVSLAVLCCNAKCSLTLVLQKRLAAKLARIQVHRMRAESAVAAHTAVLQLVNIKAKDNMFMSTLPTWRSDYVTGLLPAAGGSTQDLKATLVFHMGYHVLHRPGWDIQNLPLSPLLRQMAVPLTVENRSKLSARRCTAAKSKFRKLD